MKFYTIKPEYLSLWGEDCAEDTVITEDELQRLAAEWGKPAEDLLEQLEEAPFQLAYDFLMDKCRVQNASGRWCYTFNELSLDEAGWIAENCPSWDYLVEKDSSGLLLFDFVPVTVNGSVVPMMTAAALMDDEIREELHAKEIQDPQEYVDCYCEKHRAKYGEDFAV